MFKNLNAEIVRNGLNRKKLAEKIGMSTSTLYRKMNGKVEFRFNDIQKIVNTLNPELKIEYLFCEVK